MTSIVPDLDDIEFEELVENGRAVIPRYAPRWTDHNLHDPGITLIDLLAFLVDRQVFRSGMVGESLRRAFTRLLGIEPRGPEAARVLIWPQGDVPPLDLAAGTGIETPDVPDARFTLDEEIRTVRAEINDIATVTDGRRKPLGTGLTQGRDPVALLPFAGGGPDALEISLAPPITHIDQAGFVSLAIAVDGPGESAVLWEPVVAEQWDEGGFWRPLAGSDGTAGLSRTGLLLLRPDPAAPMARLRLRLDRGFRPGRVTLTRLALNVLPATEGYDDAGIEIGTGTGLPDQMVELDAEDVLDLDRIEVTVHVAGQTTRFEIRDDLERSGPEDPHVQLTDGGLRFGNGLSGSLVPAGAPISRGDVRRTKGADGAVAKGLRWRIVGLDYGTNVAPSTPGRNRDDLGTLVRRAREVAKRRRGLLHASEIERAALSEALGLADVRVRARRRPGLEDGEAPGSWTVLILPVRDPDARPALPNLAVRDAVAETLEPFRLLGERLHVSHPLYRDIDVALTLVIAADTDPASVRAEAEALLRARLWDLRRDSGQKVEPWPAGRAVEVGEIEGLMASLCAVSRVPACTIGDGGAMGRSPIQLKDREIALARRIDISVIREIEGGAA